MGKYDQEFQDYQRDVQSYLKQVKNGRRVPAADPQDPRFSQQADDERQAKRAGLGSYIQHGPPSPAWERAQAPPPMSTDEKALATGGHPPGLLQLRDFLDRVRGSMTRAVSTRGGAAPTPVWGFHEPTHTMAEGIKPLAGAAGNALADPRNAWIGLGPMGVLSKARSLFSKTPRVPDSGGFSPTLKSMKESSPNIAPSPDSMRYDPGNPESWRKGYLDHVTGMNEYVRKFDANNPEHIESIKRLEGVNPGLSNEIGLTAAGRMQLQNEAENAMNPKLGGGVPNRYLFDKGNGNPRR